MSAEAVAQALLARRRHPSDRLCCTIAGESGTGKTTLALETAAQLDRQGLRAVVLHQDDYFRLPPRQNHARRLQDLSQVGPAEVRLDRLAEHLRAFVEGRSSILRPVLRRAEDRFAEERLELGDARVLIVEGTYVTRLEPVDVRVFIDGTYRQTEVARRQRARDLIDERTPAILAIEHRLVQADRARAHLVLRFSDSARPR